MIRRSYLFVPGDRPDRFEKARQSGADAVIVDLEDAVQNTNKDVAREAGTTWLSPARPVYVRINGAGTTWFERDLAVVGSPGVLGFVLPKAERPEQVAQVADRLAGEARVLPLLETALGVWNARELAQAPRVERLVSPSAQATFSWTRASAASRRSSSMRGRAWCWPHASLPSCLPSMA